MLHFVYRFWMIVVTLRVYLHDDGYFIFWFENEDNRAKILNNGLYTYYYRALVMKLWIPNF